jgi:hypothetical protein
MLGEFHPRANRVKMWGKTLIKYVTKHISHQGFTSGWMAKWTFRVQRTRVTHRDRLELRLLPKKMEGEHDCGLLENGRMKLCRRLFAVKKSAARKIEFVNATTSDEASESGSMDDQEDQLLPEEYDPPSNQRPDGEQDALLRPSNTVFNPAPQITIALPQIKAEPEDDFPVGGLGPPEELVNAVEALTISPIRLQATRQLPFLRRNLRKGFISRCADVLIPIHPEQKHVSLEVTYEYVDGIVFKAKIEDCLCPLCNLFGKFTTQGTLYCHLKWDHQEVLSDWEKLDDSDVGSVDVLSDQFAHICVQVRGTWKLQIMIPQEVRDDVQAR